MPGEYTIKVNPNVTSVIHAPRQIPLSLQDKVKAELDKIEANGVIVRQDQPTPRINSMVTPIKSNGKLRICIDASVFTKLDSTSRFWQLKLDEQSTKLCTFNTPFGRYSFTRMPFGIKYASDVYINLGHGQEH